MFQMHLMWLFVYGSIAKRVSLPQSRDPRELASVQQRRHLARLAALSD
jgi:hypothetical protein